MARDRDDDEFGSEIGEYGRALKAIEKKHICPICRVAYDSQSEALKCIVEEHGVDQLPQNSSNSAS